MKPIIFNTRSLLFRLARVYGNLTAYEIQYGCSICRYNRSILNGIGMVFVTIVSSVVALSVTLSPIFYGMLYLLYPELGFTVNEFAGIGILFDAALIIIVSIGFYSDYKSSSGYVSAEPSKLTLHWRAFTNKVCYQVTFK